VAPLKNLWTWAKPVLNKRPSEGEYPASGLICLKGGDLGQEISESRLKPRMIEVYDLFPLDHYREKYLLYVHK